MKDSDGMSTGIPKSVQDALSRQAVTGPHPAAGELTAYAERSLAQQEESAVMAHLATCAECREVVFLAHSAYEAPQKPVVLVERRSMWRWAMPATALLAFVIGFIVLLRNENPKATPVAQTAQVTQQAEPATAAKEQDAVKTEPRVADKDAAAGEGAPATGSRRKEEPPLAKSKPADKKSYARAKPEVSLTTTQDLSRPLAAPSAAMPAGYAGGVNAMAGAGVGAYAAPVVAGSSVQSSGNVNSNAQLVQKSQRGGPSQSTNQVATQSLGGTYKNENALKDMAVAAVPQAPPSAPANRDETKLPEERQAEGQPQTFAASSMLLEAAPQKQQRNVISRMAITVWRISSDGHLERMMQDQWHRALGGVQKSFRAVAYLGNHVWAGGAGPELYHSADGGENWNTLKVKTEDAELKGAMQSIKATDDKHVAIIADDGSVWVTNNGGTTWTKQ